ncbi:MAG: MATE family efflux transporter [Eubacteriales bacterium]|nr:MATE family efflux transporter [Eubacteriales bacterium]
MRLGFRLKRSNLTEGVIWKQLLLFALPLLLTNFLQQLYNAADLLIVGRYAGKEAMAGVGATGSVSMMLIGLFMGLATGVSVLVAQFYGGEDYDSLYHTVHTAHAVALASGLLLTVAGWFLAPTLLELMQTPEDIMQGATAYMRLFFLGIIPLLIYNMGAGILRATGDSQRPFIFLLISATGNIIFDFIFVKYWNWGIKGAAWATVLSQTIAALAVIVTLVRSDEPFRLFLRDIRINFDFLQRILAVGLPAGMQSVVISLSNVLIQSKINSFGSDAIAGIAAAGRIDGFIFTGLQAISLAATTFAGQNLGAGLYRRLKQGAKSAVALVSGIAFVLSAMVLTFRHQLIGVFNSDPNVQYYGLRMMLFLASTYWVFGISDVLAGFVRGTGKSLPPMIIALVSMCGLRILWLYIALPLWDSIDVIILSYPISWSVTLIANFIYFKFGKWLPKEVQKVSEMEL